MPDILQQLLTTALSDLHQIEIPYAPDGFARLHQHIYTARWYLRGQSESEIEQALADVLDLYHWFYEQQAIIIRKELTAALKQTDSALHNYINIDQCVVDHIESLKLSFVSDIDVIVAIFCEYPAIAELRDIEIMSSDLTNSQYFALLCLYKAANAISALHEYQKNIAAEKAITNNMRMFGPALAKAIRNSSDVDDAIAQAREFDLLTRNTSIEHRQDWLKLARQELSQTALQARFGDRFHLRKTKAIELYQQGNYTSRREAALKIVKPLNQFIIEHDLKPLKADSEFDSIYKWLSEFDKTK